MKITSIKFLKFTVPPEPVCRKNWRVRCPVKRETKCHDAKTVSDVSARSPSTNFKMNALCHGKMLFCHDTV